MSDETRQAAERWLIANGIGYYNAGKERLCPRVRAVMDLIDRAHAEGRAEMERAGCDGIDNVLEAERKLRERAFAEGRAAGLREARTQIEAAAVVTLDAWLVGPCRLLQDFDKPAPAGVPRLCAKCGQPDRYHGDFGFRDHEFVGFAPAGVPPIRMKLTGPECLRCGGREDEHCQLDEPGVDHANGCNKMHHEFKAADVPPTEEEGKC